MKIGVAVTISESKNKLFINKYRMLPVHKYKYNIPGSAQFAKKCEICEKSNKQCLLSVLRNANNVKN